MTYLDPKSSRTPFVPVDDGRRVDRVSLLIAGATLLAMGISRSGVIDYWSGSRNGPSGFGLIGLLLVTAVISLVGVLAAWVWACAVLYRKRSRGRAWFSLGVAGLLVAAMCVTCALKPPGDTMYKRGFAGWARRHVSVTAISTWSSTLPPFVSPPPTTAPVGNKSESPFATTPVASANWPTSISGISPPPAMVGRIKGGVLLTWGNLGPFSDARAVFVGDTPTSVPPDVELPGLWLQAGPGLWVTLDFTD